MGDVKILLLKKYLISPKTFINICKSKAFFSLWSKLKRAYSIDIRVLYDPSGVPPGSRGSRVSSAPVNQTAAGQPDLLVVFEIRNRQQ